MGSPAKRPKCLATNWIRTPGSPASVRPRLFVKIPGGVGLKSGYPGSAGEPGFGLGWALGGHRGGVTRLPGAPWRAGRNGRVSFVSLLVFSILFSSPRFEDFPLVPRDSRTPPLTHALWGRG